MDAPLPPITESAGAMSAPVQPAFPVVGFGASAGGIPALQCVFEKLPPVTGMAFVVVMHLSPNHQSALASILQKVTRLRVVEVTQQVRIEADCVYVIAPNGILSMSDGYLQVQDQAPTFGSRQTIDLFFRTLAEAHRAKAIGVVLSGGGSDGTQGLKRLKELGGVALAQRPDDAEFDSMPRHAIASGVIDIVLPARDMPQRLLQLWDNARRLELPAPPPDLGIRTTEDHLAEQTEEALLSIQMLLRQRTGHDFSHYKRATVLRRLERRMQVTLRPSLPAYLQLLREVPAETEALLQDMLISVTHFFRDPDAFDALAHELMEQAGLKSAREGESFRAWVIGCATGEEAYSVAITLSEAMVQREDTAVPVTVFASDIDQRAIHFARAGLYPDSIANDVSLSRMHHFFAHISGYRISKRIRESVLFSNHNALHDPPFTRLDLVCCRNLLIYLDRQAQSQLLRTVHYALRDGGLLLLGNSESADVVDGLFTAVDKRQRLYRKRAGGPVGRPPQLMSGMAARSLTPGSAPPPAVAHPMATLHDRVLIHDGPPTVLIDSEHGVLHVDDRAAHLLRMPGGAPSNKLLDLVRPELRIALRTALFRSLEASRSVEASRATLSIDGELRHVAMSVRPVRGENAAGMLLVVFDETELSLRDRAGDAVDIQHPLLTALEAELMQLRTRLLDSAGDSAAFTEELRASNEQLLSTNEELRSAGEELETSREELQSVNEELVTVNQELRYRMDEATQSRDDLQNLISSAEIGTIFIDRAMRVKMFTPRAAELFNLIESDLGRSLLDLTHRLHYDELASDVAEVLHSLSKIERDVRSQGGRRYLVRLLPYRTVDDRIDGAVLTFVDVTDLRLAEQHLSDAEQRMRVVVNSLLDYALITFDTAGIITSWSAGAVRMFGYEVQEAIGQPAELIFTFEDRRNGVPQAEMRKASETGRAEDDRWHRRKNGQTFFCSGIMTPLVDGEVLGYAKIGRDLTNSKLMEAQREAILRTEVEVRGRLEEASVMKDELMAVLAHELKYPLNLISLNAELLLRMPQVRNEAAVARVAGTIRKAVTSQAQIIDDLFDMSRLNTRKLVLANSRVELGPVVERITGAIRADAEAKAQTIETRIGGDVAVYGDPVRVEQIVWNLMTNALKFTPPGGKVGVAVSVDGEMARIDVSDTGIGLQPAHIRDVFEMFRQVDSGSTRSRGGLGIGLALVKRIAELHGGRVRAASDGLNRGSTFSVWLPLDNADDRQLPDEERSPVLRGLRIMLVDDQSDATASFGDLLRLEGAVVTEVNSAKQAFELAVTQPFDVVLSDISMPIHDGHWLIQQIRGDECTRGLRVIAVSGLATPLDRQTAIDAGFDAHLGKPLRLDALKETIDGLLRRPAA